MANAAPFNTFVSASFQPNAISAMPLIKEQKQPSSGYSTSYKPLTLPSVPPESALLPSNPSFFPLFHSLTQVPALGFKPLDDPILLPWPYFSTLPPPPPFSILSSPIQ